MQEKLEAFLNNFKGEVVSILPNVRSTFQLMGATAKIDYILVVKKRRWKNYYKKSVTLNV